MTCGTNPRCDCPEAAAIRESMIHRVHVERCDICGAADAPGVELRDYREANLLAQICADCVAEAGWLLRRAEAKA